MDALVAWLDQPMRYWIASWVVLAAALAAALAPFFSARSGKMPSVPARILNHPATFLVLAFLVLLVLRLPAILYPFALNADEPQGLAQAIALCEDPLFYRAVQSGSAGPLWTYPIMLPGIFGLDINYATGRFTGLVLVWITCAVLYSSLRLLGNELVARVASFSAFLCFAVATKPDFLHYSSEHPALPLVSIACFFILRLRLTEGESPLRDCFLLGLALGVVPFAKLVVTTIALLIAAIAFYVILSNRNAGRKSKLKSAAALAAGGMTLPAVFLSMAAMSDFNYFWQTYIVNNYHYKQRGETFGEIASYYLDTPLIRQPGFEVFFIAVIAFCLIRLVGWAVDRENWKNRPWFAFSFSALMFAASWYAVAAPGRGFPHYLLLTIMPMALFAGVLATNPAALPDGDDPSSPAPGRFTWNSALAAGVLLLPLCIFQLRPLFTGTQPRYYTLDRTVGKLQEIRATPPPPVAQVILQLKQPGDQLTVWGWRADYHVETQLGMGTRSAVPSLQILDTPVRDFYRKTALEEFMQRRPAFFVDATGPLSINFNSRDGFGHHIFPDLAEYVSGNYSLAVQTPAELLYIRNDRYQQVLPRLQNQNPPAPVPAKTN